MLLAIDVGNTNSVFAVHDGDAFVGEWRAATDASRTADEYFVWFSQVAEHWGVAISDVTDVVISSTAPRTVFNLRILCDRYFGTRPIVVRRGEVELGIDVRVDANTAVGPDRLVNTVAAHASYGGDLIVVDFGTATTFDVVDHDGAYAGGIIAPGVNLSIKALHDAAAALPDIDVTRPDRVVGLNTIECMQSGVYWGYISLVEGLCARIATERAREMRVIGTGGLSSLFARGTDIFDHIDDDLTLRGLVLIHERNKKGH